jgi:Serine dehydrogenase proteinase.
MSAFQVLRTYIVVTSISLPLISATYLKYRLEIENNSSRLIKNIKKFSDFSLPYKLNEEKNLETLVPEKLQNKKNKIYLAIKSYEEENPNKKLLFITNNTELTELHPQIYNNNDSFSLIRDMHLYKSKDIELVLHTCGGSSYHVKHIMTILLKYKLKKSKINVTIPFYAFSARTVIASCGNVINLM